MQIKIDYQLIADSISYYKSLGYKYVDVDWCASDKAISLTKPDQCSLVSIKDNFLVASAEQSLLDMILNNKLTPDKYVACSPCFRINEFDETHFPYFLKVELMYYLGQNNNSKLVDQCIKEAKGFFNRYLSVNIKEYKDTTDIEFKDIELGSYGIRHRKDIGYWVFGTGCAEPRLSYCRGLNK